MIGAPFHQSRGFQRPIKLYTKGETPTTERTPATVVSDQTPATSSSDRTPAVFFDHKHASEYVPLSFSEHPVRCSDYSPSHYYEPYYNEIMPPEALPHRSASLIDNNRHQPRNRVLDMINEHGSDSSGVYSETRSVLDGHSPNMCGHSAQTSNSEKCELCLNKVIEATANTDSQEPETFDSQTSATVSCLEETVRCSEADKSEMGCTSVTGFEHIAETNQLPSSSVCTKLSVSTVTVSETSVCNETRVLSESDDVQESAANTQTIIDDDTIETSVTDETLILSQETLVCTQSSTFADDEMTESSKSGSIQETSKNTEETAAVEETCE